MKKICLMSITLLTLSACQTVYIPKAREVRKKPKSNGVIALPANYRNEDRARAEELMRINCGSLVANITDEGEAIIGQETKSNTNTTQREDSRQSAGNLFGIPVVAGSGPGTNNESSSITRDLKEWQITYNCEIPEKGNNKTKR